MPFIKAEDLIMTSHARSCMRACGAIFYLRCHITIPLNLLRMIVACWVVSRRPVFDTTHYPQSAMNLCNQEVFQFVIFTMIEIAAETVVRNIFRSEVSLKSKEQQLEKQETEIQQSLNLVQAMHAVVDSFCDVVVELDRNLCVVGSGTKQRAFFNMEMNGKLFSELLIGEDKRHQGLPGDCHDRATARPRFGSIL